MEPVCRNAEDVFSLKTVEQNQGFCPQDDIVLLTFDDNYVDQSVNLILSIAQHHPKGVSFVCVCPVLRPENVELLMGLSQGIQLRSYEFTLSSLAVDTVRWSLCAVLRLFCPWLLEDTIHRVLYMDSDILCSGSLRELFDLDVPCIAMCNEISGNVSNTQQKQMRSYLPTEIYCNSGVVVFNLDCLRENYTFQELYKALCAISGKVTYLDQDFLNIFFRGKITYVNAFHYNFQAYELRKTPFYETALRNCRLIHFSVGKPWKYKTRLRFILLYLKYSRHPAMIRRVRKTLLLSILYCPIRISRRIVSRVKHLFLRG